MGLYDQAFATGNLQWLDDLIKGFKAKVKAHFRKDPTTGKLIYIKEHERELHPTHVVFQKGDKIRILHGSLQGKEGVVKGYSEEKHVLRVDVPGYHNVGLTPHKAEHVEKTAENTPGEVAKDTFPEKIEPSEQEFLEAMSQADGGNEWTSEDIQASEIVAAADDITSGDPNYEGFPSHKFTSHQLFYGGMALSQIGEPEKAKKALELLKENAQGGENVTPAGDQPAFKVGDIVTGTQVIKELPSGTVVECYANGAYWKKAKMVDKGEFVDIYLENMKTHGWNTVPLTGDQQAGFEAGYYGELHLKEIGDGKIETQTCEHNGNTVLGNSTAFNGHKVMIPSLFSSKAQADKVAEKLNSKGVKAEVIEDQQYFNVKIVKDDQPEEPEPSDDDDEEEKEPEKWKTVAGVKLVWSNMYHGYMSANAKTGFAITFANLTQAESGLEKLKGLGFSGYIVGLGKPAKCIKITKFPGEEDPDLVKEPEATPLSPSMILNMAKGGGALDGWSDENIHGQVEAWKKHFGYSEESLKKLDSQNLSGHSNNHLAFMAIALTEMGKHAEAHKVFDELKAKLSAFPTSKGDPEKIFTTSDHHAFIKKLRNGDVNAAELKAAFQKFIGNKGHIRNELEAMAVKQLEGLGGPVKKKSEMVSHIMHNMMTQYVPGGSFMWDPLYETYEQGVQKHLGGITDDRIQGIVSKKKAEKAAYQKAISKPKTLEDYEKYIQHHGESMLGPLHEEKYHALLKEKADQEAAAKAKIPPKIQTKEVGFHGHFLSDNNGIKVFFGEADAHAAAAQLQGHGINAHAVHKIVKISEPGDPPPKITQVVPKTVTIGPDNWVASPITGKATAYATKEEALVAASKFQQAGINAIPSGLGVLILQPGPATKIDFTYHEFTHTKQGHKLYAAKLTDQIDKATHSALLAKAKKYGGYYSSYDKDGAIPGFLFKDHNKAKQFMAEAKGEPEPTPQKKQEPAFAGSALNYGAVIKALKLTSYHIHHEDMQHELMRVDTMSDKALQARVGKIKSDQKLYNFYQALIHKSKHDVASVAYTELQKRAAAKIKGE